MESENKSQQPRHIKKLRNSDPILLGDFYYYQTRSDISGKMQFLRDIFLLLLKNKIKEDGLDWAHNKEKSPEDLVKDLVSTVVWYADFFDMGLRKEAKEENEFNSGIFCDYDEELPL